MDLIFATNNSHKLKEIRAAVGRDHRIISLEEAGISTEIPEEYPTLEENARSKADFIYNMTGTSCFADDTGLEVYSLDYRPGVHSARYSMPETRNIPESGISKANILKLLGELKDSGDRAARFRTVISLIMNGEVFFFEGIVQGYILDEPRGGKGFGYDPVFCPEGFAESFAEMDLVRKNQISHRAIAVGKLIDFLKKL